MTASPRILFMGSPAFAIPTLDRLIALKAHVITVVCQPDRPAGRGLKLKAPAVKECAQKNGLPVLQPEKLDAHFHSQVRALKPDLAIVIAYGKILKSDFIDIPQFGCVNLHASLLPHLRGAAPIVWSILNGDRETGISLQKIDTGLDTGDVILENRLSLDGRETGGSLTEQLSQLAAETCATFFNHWSKTPSPLSGKPQDHALATYAPKIDASLLTIDWSQPAEHVLRKIRAFSPDWGARARDAKDPDQGIYKILAAELVHEKKQNQAPGTVSVSGGIRVQCGDGSISILSLKPPGSRALSAHDFLNGRTPPLRFV